MFEKVPVITIDGPSGSGKGTISRSVAAHFGWHFMDSGAIYRVLALYALQQHCRYDDTPHLVALAKQLPVVFIDEEVILDNIDVSAAIRTEECGAAASGIAVNPAIRAALLERQRQFAQLPGLVADGRDMGTVVFPDAFLKVYLDASAKERAKRRYLQLKQAGYSVNLQNLEADIMQRDERDKTRAAAPLKPAAGALIIDTTAKSISEVFEIVTTEAKLRLSKH
jgi:cytidylate kinase